MDAIDPALQLLEIEAIKRLKAKYFRLMDTKQWEAWAELFSDDARFDGTSSGPDRESFVAGVSRHLADVRSVHHGHMPEIVLTGPDTARGIWAMFDYLEWQPGSRRPRGGGLEGQRGLVGFGHYEEEYRKQHGVWKITFLRLTRLRVDPLLDARPPLLEGWLASGGNDWLEGAAAAPRGGG
jgi:SnoaL-like domain